MIRHIIFTFLFVILSVAGYAVLHEVAHKAIYYNHGCDSHIGVSWSRFYTQVVGPCPQNDSMELAHNINEIQG